MNAKIHKGVIVMKDIILKIVELSTAHIQQETGQFLNQIANVSNEFAYLLILWITVI